MAGPSTRCLFAMGGKYEPCIRDEMQVWRCVNQYFSAALLASFLIEPTVEQSIVHYLKGSLPPSFFMLESFTSAGDVTCVLLSGVSSNFNSIYSNLVFQMMFGFTFETRWGWQRFALLYLITGIGASLLSCVASPESVRLRANNPHLFRTHTVNWFPGFRRCKWGSFWPSRWRCCISLHKLDPNSSTPVGSTSFC